MQAERRRGTRLLTLAIISVNLGATLARAEVVAQAVQTNDSRPLGAHEERLQFDGATIKFLVFQGRNQVMRYLPSTDWLAGTDLNRLVFTKGKVTATLAVQWTGSIAAQALPAPAELQQFAQETFARLRGEGVAPPATLLPLRLGELVFAESTVASGLPGRSRILQRIRTWGPDWQVQVEITGPEQEFNKVAPAFLDSIGNMQIRSTADVQLETAAREKEVLVAEASAASRQVHPDATPAPRTRGWIK